jgi:DNA-binding CsgD family transcriptional regulator
MGGAMLTQSEWEKLNDLVITINNIADSTAMRTAFLQKLMTLIEFDFSEFDIGIIKKASAPQLVDPVMVSKFSRKFEEEFIYQYENIYAPMDYVNWVFMSPESLVYRESDLLNDEVRKQSPFYLNYLKVFDLVYIAGIVLAGRGRFHGAISLYKRENNGNFSDRDIYILKQLMPHLHARFEADSDKIRKNEKSLSFMLKNQFKLTNREIEIMGCIYLGCSNAQIAEKAGIAFNTAKKHVYNIYEKLEVENRTQLIKFIINNNLSGIWKDG